MTKEVWFDGLASALIAAVIAALVAVVVVRMQVKADRRLAQRGEDVRVAVLLMECAIRYGYGMHESIAERQAGRDPQPPMHEPGLALWAAAATAYCQRPEDSELRRWAVAFQKLLIQRTSEFVRNPQVSRLTETNIAWANNCASVLASYLEADTPLGDSPDVRLKSLMEESEHGV